MGEASYVCGVRILGIIQRKTLKFDWRVYKILERFREHNPKLVDTSIEEGRFPKWLQKTMNKINTWTKSIMQMQLAIQYSVMLSTRPDINFVVEKWLVYSKQPETCLLSSYWKDLPSWNLQLVLRNRGGDLGITCYSAADIPLKRICVSPPQAIQFY